MTLTKYRPKWPTSSQSVKEYVGQHRETCEGERTPTSAKTATHSNLLVCPQCAEGETPKPLPRGHNKDPLRLPGTVADQGSLWCETTPPSRAHSNHHDCYGRPACQTSLTTSQDARSKGTGTYRNPIRYGTQNAKLAKKMARMWMHAMQ